MKELLLTIKSLLASLAPNQCNVVLRNFAIEAVTSSQLLARNLILRLEASILVQNYMDSVYKKNV